jgi:hypothetical protein
LPVGLELDGEPVPVTVWTRPVTGPLVPDPEPEPEEGDPLPPTETDGVWVEGAFTTGVLTLGVFTLGAVTIGAGAGELLGDGLESGVDGVEALGVVTDGVVAPGSVTLGTVVLGTEMPGTASAPAEALPTSTPVERPSAITAIHFRRP